MTGAATPARIVTLDIVRGVAVMGILAMNIAGFGLPGAAYFDPASVGFDLAVDRIAWTANFILVDGKMRGLFSLLFGAGILLVLDRAEARGEPPEAVHRRRMLWLFAFGVAHFALVWWGDILMLFAAIGLIALLFAGDSVRRLVRTGIVLILIHFILSLAMSAALFATEGATSPDLQSIATAFNASPGAVTAEIALHRSAYGAILLDRVADWNVPLVAIVIFGFETLGYFLLGMAAYRSGFLTGAWDDRRYRTWALIGLAVGLPAYAGLALLVWRSEFAIPWVYLCTMSLPTLIRPTLIVAYVALIILATRRGGWLTQRIAAAGRMAFSNYLGSSLVMTTVFYGYGFGLFGTLSRWELWLPVLAMWIAMLAWSKPWLDHFAYGPFEWAWRSLSRGHVQPMRRQIRPND